MTNRVTKFGLLALPSLIVLVGCTASPTPAAAPSPTPSPTTFAVDGTVSATASKLFKPGTTELLPEGSPCVTKDGYDDIAEGAQVEVLDETNTTIGLTSLGAGTTNGRTSCIFTFRVDDLPLGHPFYAFQVGGDQRGMVKFTAADVADGEVALEVG